MQERQILLEVLNGHTLCAHRCRRQQDLIGKFASRRLLYSPLRLVTCASHDRVPGSPTFGSPLGKKAIVPTLGSTCLGAASVDIPPA